MHNAEAAIEPAFYDHEDDIVQRDRVAADWGADEVFATVPRRRFRGDHVPASQQPRRGAHLSAVPAPTGEEAAARAAWLAEVEAELTAPAPAPLAVDVAPQEELALTDGVEFVEDDAPAGRRTVTITGRPDGLPRQRGLSLDRRRPPRTVDERLGSRPDRVAGWAFGMGILLIVVAAFS